MNRPWITLSYAQSLDGCIAAAPGQRTLLSGPETMKMTHQLRAQHDAILVGVGTVIADNPRLNVRLVEGSSPQPIVLDSHLRIPLQSALIQSPTHPVWVFCSTNVQAATKVSLEAAGGHVFMVNEGETKHIDLSEMLHVCYTKGIRSLMVEGGAKIIQAFLRAGLVDEVVITITPGFLTGLAALTTPLSHLPQFITPKYQVFGSDIVVTAKLLWET